MLVNITLNEHICLLDTDKIIFDQGSSSMGHPCSNNKLVWGGDIFRNYYKTEVKFLFSIFNIVHIVTHLQYFMQDVNEQ